MHQVSQPLQIYEESGNATIILNSTGAQKNNCELPILLWLMVFDFFFFFWPLYAFLASAFFISYYFIIYSNISFLYYHFLSLFLDYLISIVCKKSNDQPIYIQNRREKETTKYTPHEKYVTRYFFQCNILFNQPNATIFEHQKIYLIFRIGKQVKKEIIVINGRFCCFILALGQL